MPDNGDVGYKRPPKSTQFKKGQSGNPRGRPKGTKDLKTDLAEELQERVLVKEGSTERKISKQRAMVKSLMAKAMKGDARAIALAYNMVLRLFDLDEVEEAEVPLNEDERAVFQTLEDQILRRIEERKASEQLSEPSLPAIDFIDISAEPTQGE
jgi:hypothetical protein